MKIRYMILLSALVMSALACQVLSPSSDDVAQETEAISQPSNILFQDDFSDSASGWDQVNVADGITDYESGIYRIFVNTANTDVWANPGLSLSDVMVEVDATKVGGDDNNDFGVICRYQDTSNFYFFIISSDGYYGIGKVVDGEQQLIGTDTMPPSDAVNQGSALNHIRAECVGNKLGMYVNGSLLDEVSDTGFSTGDVGLIAGSFDIPGTDIHFDNFKVTQP